VRTSQPIFRTQDKGWSIRVLPDGRFCAALGGLIKFVSHDKGKVVDYVKAHEPRETSKVDFPVGRS
jgi:hypothetical protein